MAKVSINKYRNSYRLRWSYRNTRYSLSIHRIGKESLKAAKAKAKLIESDILFDRFDSSLAKYGKEVETTATSIFSKWNKYKETNSKRIALTSQQNGWKNVDRCLEKIQDPKLLALDKADELVNKLLEYYSPGTLKRVLIDLNSAYKGYYSLSKLPKIRKSPIEVFSNEEIRAIIQAFETDKYNPKSSRYKHSYYTNYVKFLAYTGCRPEEAIALTWEKVDLYSSLICFNKAYSKGILKDTKNHKVRLFPINKQLEKLLLSIDRISYLVFPSVTNSYIIQKDWHKRYWNKVLNGLVADNLIKKRLRSYCLRHSFITRCIHLGYDIATVAEISGNSVETIINYYLAAKELQGLDLPEI